jgi:titin
MFRFRNSAEERSSSFGFFLFSGLIFSFLSFCSTAQGATWTVTNTNDSGVGSLRLAIISANTNPGPDTITFSIPGCGVACTIHLLTSLPLSGSNGSNTAIDGYTQTGSAAATATTPAAPKIEIDGSGIANNHCLNISSSGNVIKGLIINRCTANGIFISGSGATGNRVSGNLIGTNYNGFSNGPNTFHGVFIGSGAQGNIVGGDTVADRNLISGNNWSGVAIGGPGTINNVVSGNYIGTFPAGDFAMPNVQNGIRIYNGAQYNTIGGDTEGQRNLISGNGDHGIRIDGADTSNNTVSGNFIGANADGSGAVGNINYGLYLGDGTHHNAIGGSTPGRRNIISGNQGNGITLSTAHWNTLSGNFIGTDLTGIHALANAGNAIELEGSNNVIGGDTPGERNIISGNGVSAVQIHGASTPSVNNVIKGNYIGLAADGITPLPNRSGIDLLNNVQYNTVGGNSPGQRNVISGNNLDGVSIYGSSSDATNNTVSGNYIGIDASGRFVVGNSNRGVYLGPRAKNNLIGGDLPGSRNVISGNDYGIMIAGQLGINNVTGNTVKSNYIGADAGGTNRLGNAQDGIHITTNAKNSTVGPNNLIAYNGGDGVRVDTPTTTGHLITHNRIFQNEGLGIHLTNGANSDIPAPAIQSTTFGPIGSIRIAVSACGGCAVQVFNSRVPDGEGEVYLGGGVADAAGNYTLVVSGLPFPYLTATASDLRGTSEFSLVFTSTAYLLHLPMILR